MEVSESNIYSILDGKKQYIVPVYQRFYSWEDKQCQCLWDDIVEMQTCAQSGHFLGAIVIVAEKGTPTGVNTFTIIDGQQRLTTLTLLLVALRDYVTQHPDDDTSIDPDEIDDSRLKNVHATGEKRYKLLLTETDRDVLKCLIDQKSTDDKFLKDNELSKVFKCYKLFEANIAKIVAHDTEYDLTLEDIYTAIGKLQIVVITLNDSDDAQAIYKSMNSTGKDLLEADLIRNHVLMGLEHDDQLYVYKNLWRPMETLFNYESQDVASKNKNRDISMDRFFRDYLSMKSGRIPNLNRIYETFRAQYPTTDLAKAQELCNDLLEHARYYTDMIFTRSKDPALKNLYADMSTLKMEVAYPFLLKVHHDRAKGKLTEDSLIEIVKMCVIYILRRNVCDLKSNALNKAFIALKNCIPNDAVGDDYMNAVRAFFINSGHTAWRFPNDDEFVSKFTTRDVYRMTNTREFILCHLEDFNKKVPINIENYTIEHIMPQNPNLSAEWQAMLGDDWREVRDKWLHTIGNLTLTAYNSEMSDRPFMEKMDMPGGFKESSLKLNAYVVKQSKWTQEKICERAALLAEEAKQIWPYPVADGTLFDVQTDEKPGSIHLSLIN